MCYSKRKWFFFPFIFLAAIAGLSLFVMLLWNTVIPEIFHLEEISYIQAMLLLILARILFGGGPFRHHPSHSHSSLRDKFKKMSPEEQEELKKNWRNIRQSHWHCQPDGQTEKKQSENDSESN